MQRVGDVPLIVVSEDVSKFAEGSFGRNYGEILYPQHEALAQLSARGVHRIIEGVEHDIELDRPQAITEAVNE